MANVHKSGTGSEDIENQLKTIRADMAKLTKMVGEFGKESVSEQAKGAMDEIREMLESSKRYAGEKRDQAKKTAETVEEYINEKPVQSTIIALIVGLLIGTLSRR
jgi:ElaB/YqjD/DUF883 family membrane-anchored ribosome-binding protein